MTYQYTRLAVGRKKKWKDIDYAVPCDEQGTPLSFRSEEEEMFQTWAKKVIGYEIIGNVMYCRLEGVTA